MKFSGKVSNGTRNKWFEFGGDQKTGITEKKVILENNWWTNYQFESSCQMYVCMVEGFKKKSYNWITTLAEVCIHTSLVLQYFSDREKYGQIVVFKT